MTCPLTRKPCNKHKAFHITEKSADKTETYLVCEDCLYLSTTMEIKTNEPSKECATCGLKLSDILKGSRMGCKDCYTSFNETMEEVIKKVQQSSTQHVGKICDSWKKAQAEEMSLTSFVEELNAKINIAVKTEQYELALSLKKKMNEFAEMLRKYKDAILSDEKNQEEKAPALRQRLTDFIYAFKNSI